VRCCGAGDGNYVAEEIIWQYVIGAVSRRYSSFISYVGAQWASSLAFDLNRAHRLEGIIIAINNKASVNIGS